MDHLEGLASRPGLLGGILPQIQSKGDV